jgi:hypothetical protein
MEDNLGNVIKEIDGVISIISFEKINIIAVKKLKNSYYIDVDLDMNQHFAATNGKISALEVSERWVFKKTNKKTNWLLDNISDNNE